MGVMTISGMESSRYLSSDRLLAFMKKLATVDTLSPSCSAMVTCISLVGRRVSLKIASKVLLWMSVNTNLGFFGPEFCGRSMSVSFLLQATSKRNVCCRYYFHGYI